MDWGVPVKPWIKSTPFGPSPAAYGSTAGLSAIDGGIGSLPRPVTMSTSRTTGRRAWPSTDVTCAWWHRFPGP